MSAVYKQVLRTCAILLFVLLGSTLLKSEKVCCEGECCLEQGCKLIAMAEELNIPPTRRLDFAAAMAEGGFCGKIDLDCCCQTNKDYK